MYGDRDASTGAGERWRSLDAPTHFDDWIQQLCQGTGRGTVAQQIPREEASLLSEGDLVERCRHVFETLYPLFAPTAASVDPPKSRRRIHEPFPLAECALRSRPPEKDLERWVRTIERKGQAVFYGPPGTGKTFIAGLVAQHLVGGGDGVRDLVQLHPAYSYEDFIQGIRPVTGDNGSLSYEMVPGRFLDFCSRAEGREGTSVLVIDEINRANLSRVFGELMYLLEYRDQEIPLAGGDRLRIPENVRILGTMNTADRSIALVDHALRRRFAFIPLHPRLDVLEAFHEDTGFQATGLVSTLRLLNGRIQDPSYAVGISFFLHENLETRIEDIWRMEITPYLEEYFFDQRSVVEEFSWERVGPTILPTA